MQEKQSEISELQTRLAAAADKNVALTEGHAALDARLHEAQAAASRASLTQTRLEQEKDILAKSNAWLSQVRCEGRRPAGLLLLGVVWAAGCCCLCRCVAAALSLSCCLLPRVACPQELERKSEAFNAERRKATDTILDLQRRLAEAESTAQRLQVRRCCGRRWQAWLMRCSWDPACRAAAAAVAGACAAGAGACAAETAELHRGHSDCCCAPCCRRSTRGLPTSWRLSAQLLRWGRGSGWLWGTVLEEEAHSWNGGHALLASLPCCHGLVPRQCCCATLPTLPSHPACAPGRRHPPSCVLCARRRR